MNFFCLSIYLAGMVTFGLCLNVNSMSQLSDDETSAIINWTDDEEMQSLVDKKIGSAKTSPQIEEFQENNHLPFPKVTVPTPTLTPAESYFNDTIIFHDDEQTTKADLQ